MAVLSSTPRAPSSATPSTRPPPPPPPQALAARRGAPSPGRVRRSFVDDEAPTTKYLAGAEPSSDSGVHARPEPPELVVLGEGDLVEIYDTLPSVVIDDLEILDERPAAPPVPRAAASRPTLGPPPSVPSPIAPSAVAARARAARRSGVRPIAPLLHPKMIALPVVPRRPVVTAPVIPISSHLAAPPPPLGYPAPASWSPPPPPALGASFVDDDDEPSARWPRRLSDELLVSPALLGLVLVTGALTGLAAWLIAFR